MIDPSWFSSTVQSNLFVGSFYIWFVIEMINTLVIGRHRQGGQRQDRGSVWGVLVLIYAAIVFILLSRQHAWGVLPTLFQWIGLALVWLGIVVRSWAILSLGRAFTAMVEVNPQQRLVRSGPYCCVRHPAYTGGMLTLTGFGLAAGTWVGAALALGIVFAGYSYRVRVEERAMLEAFGEEYREYMRQSGRFLPKI
ncbi:MAG: isoprenylcysteine carboxylmethyltransferase family protein [Anaerolineaceae bacterium]|nr:isoprenylcysteine carboxylmethyltransferase family protein [Anaerolineaceae bacterium]